MSETIEGLDKLNHQLASLKNLSTHSLLAGAYVLERYAKENELAYVDTGFLMNSISSRENGNGAEVVASANYAAYQEFGTEKMQAQPYFRPAIEDHSNEIIKAIASEIEKEMEGKIN